MKRPTQLLRILHINFVMTKHGIDRVILSTRWFYPLRFLSYLNPWTWGKRGKLTRGERIRQILEDLGPIFVKFGQILSTRRDMVPDDIAIELEKLQDRVPPFPGEQAKALVEKVYGRSIHEVFQDFDLEPLASASIAQVHAATLLDGRKAVVKILRPNIEKVIRRDVALLYSLAGLVEKFWSEGPRLHPREMVAEFERHIIDELDLMREAANASQLRRNFLHSPILYVPEVYWEYARQNVVVFERIEGIPITNFSALKQQKINMKKLAENGVEIFFTQVFRDSFFHADMHPGNIFVSSKNPNNPQYIAVDFGIMGTLSPTDQRYLAENLLAFFKRDYRKVAVLHVESGWVWADTRVEEFESAIRAVCEPIFERPLKDISFGLLILRLFQTAKRFHMEIQPQLLLLQKTLLNIEGLGRQLYPDLDLWVTAKPFLERWAKDKIRAKALLSKAYENVPSWAEKFMDMPDLLYQTLCLVREQALIKKIPQQTKKQSQKNPRIRRKGFYLGFGLALIAVALLNLFYIHELWQDHSVFNWILVGLGVISLLFSK